MQRLTVMWAGFLPRTPCLHSHQHWYYHSVQPLLRLRVLLLLLLRVPLLLLPYLRYPAMSGKFLVELFLRLLAGSLQEGSGSDNMHNQPCLKCDILYHEMGRHAPGVTQPREQSTHG